MNIARFEPCMPAAELAEQVDPCIEEASCRCGFRLVALAFSGTAPFESLDEASEHSRVKAQSTVRRDGAARRPLRTPLRSQIGTLNARRSLGPSKDVSSPWPKEGGSAGRGCRPDPRGSGRDRPARSSTPPVQMFLLAEAR